MSPPPLDYSTGGNGMRPSGVTPIAIIGIVLGALGIFCLGCGGLGLVMQMNNPNARHVLTHDQLVLQIFFSIAGLAIAILLLSASIGALNLARWSRKAFLIYAVVELIFGAFRCFYALTRGLEQTNNSLQNPALPPNPTTQQVQAAQMIKAYGAGFRTGIIAFGIILFALVAVYCVWILIVMRRQDVIDAFEGNAPPGPPPGYPPQYPPTYPPQQQY